jgi:hypothetical protein
MLLIAYTPATYAVRKWTPSRYAGVEGVGDGGVPQ